MSLIHMLLRPPRRYLRYLHLREAITRCGPASVLMVGTGRGLAEIAIAKEFPDIRFHLTDWDFPHRRIERARSVGERMHNVTFGKLNILNPDIQGKFDLVGSVEVLEHIQEDEQAAANMIRLSGKYLFCLVPFATPEDNADYRKRRRVWENNQHYVVGYCPGRLEQLFPGTVAMQGAYWCDVSCRLKAEVEGLEPPEVVAKAAVLQRIAQADLRPQLPHRLSDAVGIWTLAAVR